MLEPKERRVNRALTLRPGTVSSSRARLSPLRSEWSKLKSVRRPSVRERSIPRAMELVALCQMPHTFDAWMREVSLALASINIPLADWQERWPFDFQLDFDAEIPAAQSAERANRFWWHKQNVALGKNCTLSPNCWLPAAHEGPCKPV